MELERLLKALADRTRLRLVNLLRERELCVCYLVEVLKSPQPKVSRHLAYLRRAGIVAARREGYWMHYRIVQPKYAAGARVFQQVLANLAEDPQMQRDLTLLQKACCKPERFERLQGAPAPTSLQEVVSGR
ncbi:MAG: ArsR/SmtB family transcription factor [Candidatus Korobacteraceae bacterium]